MGEDEKGTVRTLNTYKEVMTGLIQHHHGRVVNAPGDNVLAEFASVVDAVECAVDIQKEFKTRNAELPENRRMEFRMGVNLGDVIEDGEPILGGWGQHCCPVGGSVRSRRHLHIWNRI
jgi:adenylate cyclase